MILTTIATLIATLCRNKHSVRVAIVSVAIGAELEQEVGHCVQVVIENKDKNKDDAKDKRIHWQLRTT